MHTRQHARKSIYLSSRFSIVAALTLIALFVGTAPVIAQDDSATTTKASASDHNVAVAPNPPKQVDMPPPPTMRFMSGLSEPLVATGEVTDQENKDLDEALNAFKAAPAEVGPEGDYSDYAKPLLSFIDNHPNSAWNPALLLNIGLGYKHAGYYSRALDTFAKAWTEGRDASTSPQARLLIDRDVGELAHMHASLGHDKELEELLTGIRERPIGGPATELIQSARESLWMFHHEPGMSFLCGPYALRNMLVAGRKVTAAQIKTIKAARSGPHGFTLEELAALADNAKLKYKLIYRKPGQPVPVPSVINWANHHYAAITAKQGNVYLISDPTFGQAGGAAVTAKAIDAESSGYFLVPEKAVTDKSKWRTLDPHVSHQSEWSIVDPHSKEAKTVYGMGVANNSVPGDTKPADKHMSNCLSCAASVPTVTSSCPFCNALPTVNSAVNRAPGIGMSVVDAHAMVVSLNLNDTPVGYRPQKGLPTYATVTYNQREAEQPAVFSFSNLSPKWSHNWMSYVVDDPLNPGVSVVRVTGGGGGYAETSYNMVTLGYFATDTTDGSQFFRTPAAGTATTYEHDLPDGSKELFTLSDGATSYPRKMFLTSVVDPAGNTTTLNYDGTFRLTTVADAMGRNLTFSYGLSGFPLLITKISDPFSRSTQITYDTSQRLSSITDPVGITSSYTYSSTEPTFITQLTTPYGTSNFTDAVNPNDTVETNTRSLVMKDPLGYSDFLYFYQNPFVSSCLDGGNTIPLGLPTNDNSVLCYRDTFYWDKHAFALGVTVNGSGTPISEDFSKARITHWLHDSFTGPAVGGEIGSVKPPLELRTWLSYANQNSDESGTLDLPIYAGVVLDDGTTQAVTTTYNPIGLPLTVVDPLGRTTKYTYATNNIDLLTVQQLTTSPSTYTTIATYSSYNTQHEPQTFTGPDGLQWKYTYTASGQINTVKDPGGFIVTFNYDSSNRLSTIVNQFNKTVLTLTYDSADRVQTRTDSEGYVLTYAYDNLNRVTSITYPDSTTDLFDYTFQSGPFMGTASLELRKYTDRLGRVTTYAFDADRRLTSVTEPITATTTRTTSYDYYENGTLKDTTDANGNVTHWDIDVESRPTDKVYAFGTSQSKTETYTYAITTSRLKSITDALSQVKTFGYAKDDMITGLTYTNSVNPTPNITFAYDTYFPRMTSMVDSFGTTTYGYVSIGANGALGLKTVTPPFNNSTLTLNYDSVSRFTGFSVAGTNDVVSYDPTNRVATHTGPLGTFSYTYLGQTNQITQRSLTVGSNTFTTSWGYDTNTNDRRLISITNSGVTRSYTLGYGTSPVNPYDIMSITDTAAAGHPWATQSHAYTYDQSDRLLTASATTPGNFTYVYDPLNNATTVTTPSGTTNPTYDHLNQISTWGTLNYIYDADGNLKSGDGVKTYKWDAENRLIEIDYVGTSNKDVFAYDGLGHRIENQHTVSGTTTTTFYNWCGGHICQTRSSVHNPTGFLVKEGFNNLSTGAKDIFMPDQLESTRDVLNVATGALLQSYDYTPYGSIARQTVAPTVNYLYGNLWLDPTSSLNLSATRPMDGITGRWLTKDPMREFAGPNLYGYVGANPINRVDPSGRFALAVEGVLVGAIALAVTAEVWIHTPPGQKAISQVQKWFEGPCPSQVLNNEAPPNSADDSKGKPAEGAAATPGAKPDFVVDSNGNIVDTAATPQGSYNQPDGGRTDILQGEDHGSGLSHTHDPIINTNHDGKDFVNGLEKQGRPVSAEDVQNIQSGAATRRPPVGR
jgi:RHS repeat-associated protein